MDYTISSHEVDAIVAVASYDSRHCALVGELLSNTVVVPFDNMPALLHSNGRDKYAPWRDIVDGGVVFLPSSFAQVSSVERVSVSKRFEDIMRETNHPIRRKFKNLFIVNNCYVDPVLDEHGEFVLDDSGSPLFKVSLIVAYPTPLKWLSPVEPKPTPHGTQSMYRVDDTINLEALCRYCSFTLATWYKVAFSNWSKYAVRK